MTLATRTPREYLSKSFMQTACGEKAWYEVHHPRPWMPNEAAVFGSAVDAGASVIIGYLRAGQQVDIERAYEAAAAVIHEAAVLVDVNGVQEALDAFVAVPFDWAFAKLGTRAGSGDAFSIRLELPGIGMVDAHPDIVLRDHSIWDIKTGKRSKPDKAAAESYTELGFYAVCYEAYTGEVVPEVGYLTWVRTKQPYWQQVYAPVTSEMRRIALAEARRWADAIRASVPDRNDTFIWGPKYGCADCQYHPLFGGTCEIARPIEKEEAA